MIKYMLLCENDHEFEVWFDKGSDYDKQAKKGLVICPHCNSSKTTKAPMAPNIKRNTPSDIDKLAEEIRNDIANNCDNVGENFAEEARAMHYGEKPERGIYGKTKPSEAKELMEEGIGIVPLPKALAPKTKKKLN